MTTFRKLAWGFCFAVFGLGWSGLLYGQAPPSQDTFVSAAKPSANYGGNASLAVQGGGGTTLVQFNLTSLPNNLTASQVNKVMLRLFVSGFTAAGNFDVYLVSSTWNENTATYSSAPTLGPMVAAGTPVTAALKNTFLEVNVTPALQAWISGAQKNYGLALVASPLSSISATFDSKEGLNTSHEPQLLYSFDGLGTVSSVGSGAGLTGGPITGSGTLSVASGGITNAMLQNPSLSVNPGMGLSGGGAVSLGGSTSIGLTTGCAANQVLQWNGSAWLCSTAGIGTITGVIAGSDLTGGGTTGSITVNLDTTKIPQLAANNAFTGRQSIAATFAGPLVQSINTNNSGTGLYGQTAGASGLVTGNAAVVGDSSIALGVFGASSTLGGVYGTSSATGWAGVTGVGTTNGVSGSGSINGVVGTSGAGNGVFGQTSGSSGLANGAAAVLGDSHNYYGVWGASAGNDAVHGDTSAAGFGGVGGISTGAGFGVKGFAQGNYGVGVRGESVGTQRFPNGDGSDGVDGVAHSTSGSGVAGINDSLGGTGVFGSAPQRGWGFSTDSSVTQARDKGGWVKAMVYVDPFTASGTAITRCFNSQQTPIFGGCVSVHVTHNGQGIDTIDFGFQVDDRFVLITTNAGLFIDPVNQVVLGPSPIGASVCANCSLTTSTTQLTIVRFNTQDSTFVDVPYWVFIF